MTDDDNGNETTERPRIKVTDRRKFTADGEARTPAVDDEIPEGVAETAAPTTAAAAAPSSDPEAVPHADTPGAAYAEAPAEVAPEPLRVAPDESHGTPATGADGDTDATQAAAETPGAPGEAPGTAAPQPSMADLPRDFSAFVESMYLEAMLYMGAMPHPRTGEVVQDIELARYKIDLLAMIGEKTEGNLTDDEKRQLEEVVYQLRMVFVQQVK